MIDTALKLLLRDLLVCHASQQRLRISLCVCLSLPFETDRLVFVLTLVSQSGCANQLQSGLAQQVKLCRRLIEDTCDVEPTRVFTLAK